MSDGVKKINEYLLKDGRTLVMTQFISDTSNLAEGQIFINPTSGELKYVDHNKTWSKFKMDTLFDEGSFDTSLILDNSLHAAKITDLSISAGKIADLSITAGKIANGTITNEKFTINTIDADKLKDNSISTAKIHSSSITTSLIADKAVTTAKVADKAINISKMADNSVGTSSLVDGSVNTSKIADGSITTAKIVDGSITSAKVAAKEIKTANIDNLAVTTEKIADGAVQGKKIPDFGIKDSHINTMDGYKIIDNTLTGAKLKNNTITTNLIADKAITAAKLDADTQSEIANSLKISAAITIDGVEHYSTALVQGSVVLKNSDNTNANLTVNGNITATGDITGARVFNPWFADIAEAYIPTSTLFPGDPVALSEKGGLRVEKLTEANVSRFLGFVSNEYATLLGANRTDIESGKMVPICLVGRIKIKLPDYLEGEIGDYVCLHKFDGMFITSKTKLPTAIGRLLEAKTNRNSKVLCQLWP